MAKVSVGLRGWRFDEDAVFDEDGEFLPLDEMDEDVRDRLVRLAELVASPCDACWLVHGDENIPECNVAEAVYGELSAEVILCPEHEPDLVYWYREEGGKQYRGTEAFQDAFFEWFDDGGRAPEDFEGIEHVDTDPLEVPTPSVPDAEERAERWEVSERIDLRDADVDLDQEYPSN